MLKLLNDYYSIDSFISTNKYPKCDFDHKIESVLNYHKIIQQYKDKLVENKIYKDNLIDLILRNNKYKEITSIPEKGILVKSVFTNKMYIIPSNDKIDVKNFRNYENRLNKLLFEIMNKPEIKSFLYGENNMILWTIQYKYLVKLFVKNKIIIKPDFIPIIHSLNHKNDMITNRYGNYIYNLIINKKINKSLELGLGNGLYALYICSALKLNLNKDNYHIVISPNQKRLFQNVGIDNLKELKYKNLNYIKKPSFIYLPQLLEKFVGRTKFRKRVFLPNYERLDLCFINKKDTFDRLLLDFVYCDLLLKVDGYIILENLETDAMKELKNYLDSNYIHYNRVDSEYKSFLVYNKIKDDERNWDFHINFQK